MEKNKPEKDTIIICPKCQKSYTVSYVKNNTHASHTGGFYCPNCFCELEIIKPKSQKVKATNKKIPNNVRKPPIQLKPTEKYKLPYFLDRKRQAKHAWIIVVSTIVFAALLSVFSENTGKNSNNVTRNNGNDNSNYQKSDVPNSNQNLIRNLNSKYIGKKYDMDIADELFEKYGTPETLKGTNNYVWVAYYPKGNFTMTETKGDYIIVGFEYGRNPRE